MSKLKIDMLGANFTIQSTESEEYLDKLLGYYKRITEDVSQIDSIRSPLQIAILSGIMLCDEVYKEKQNKVALENGKLPPEFTQDNVEIEKRTREMIEKISKVL
ncbi:MAG: cell division protein ZapA [Treponema sp.]|nr:cell division protein ZapA [Treponema sp.]